MSREQHLAIAAKGLLDLIGRGKGGPFKPDPRGTYNERVEALYTALSISPNESMILPTPNALDEQHVQFAAAPVDFIDAMNMGQWCKGVIIFMGPHGEESRMFIHKMEPWPMVRSTV